jgi:cyclopropane fatty-acyl-phospholipid synthase-like methyltransferase
MLRKLPTSRGLVLRCPLCHSQDCSTLFFESRGRSISQCNHCKMAFYTCRPDDHELVAHYSVYSYESRRTLSPLTVLSLSETIDKFEYLIESRPIRVLDFGCGQGDFLLMAHTRGWSVAGIEPSPSGIRLCREAGLNNVYRDAESLVRSMGRAEFDLIVSFEVLEHLKTPAEFFENLTPLLTTRGMLLITTPNANSLSRLLYGWGRNLRYPEHINSFSLATFKYLAIRHSFRLVTCETRGLRSQFLQLLRANARPFRAKSMCTSPVDCGLQSIPASSKFRNGRYALGWYFVRLARATLNWLLAYVLIGDTLRVTLRKDHDHICDS